MLLLLALATVDVAVAAQIAAQIVKIQLRRVALSFSIWVCLEWGRA